MADGELESSSKTLHYDDGRVIHFSASDFRDKIVATDCCFVCGAARGSKTFNDEHVIPRWVLGRYNLFDTKINLPNGHTHSYGTYKMPCCKECNSLLGELIENPMSEMLDGGFELISQRLEEPGSMGGIRRQALYVWLCLLFVKTHLKDRHLREHLDFRLGDGRIADSYDWLPMHHIHCVARMPYVKGTILPDVIGTMCWYRIDDPTTSDQFDYYDLTNDHTIAMRLGDIGIVAVLNDAGACRSAWHNQIMELQGKTLTMVQLREFAARLATANRDLLNPPTFGTMVNRNLVSTAVTLYSRHDAEPHFADFNPEVFGEILGHALASFLPTLKFDDEKPELSTSAHIATGNVSFLFDKDQRFMRKLILRQETDSPTSGGQNF